MNQNEIDGTLYRAQQLIYNGSEQAARQVVANLINTLIDERAEGQNE